MTAPIFLPLFLTLAASALQAQDASVKIPRTLVPQADVKTPAVFEPTTIGPERPESTAPYEARRPKSPDAPALPSDFIDFSRVRYDEPGDGATWARGRTYKASFDAQGVTYVPYLGAQAPRNFPVRVELTSATVGGAPLVLERRGVERAADAIAIDRGALREVWHLTPDSAEQTFVLATRPTQVGVLELRMELATELAPRATAEGIELDGEHGGVRIGRAMAIDAGGRRLDLTTRLEGLALTIEVPSEFAATASYPLVVDPVYSTNALETLTNECSLPDISGSGVAGYWGAVYQYSYSATDADVYAVDVYYGFPVAGSGDWVDYTTSSWLAPRVAYNALHNTYLTTAQVRHTQGGLSEIWCRARYAGTTTQFPQRQIQSSILGSCFYADVGGDPALVGPTYFLVAWTRNMSATDWDVHARLILWDGTPHSAGTIFLANSTAYDWFPSVSKTNGRPPYDTQEWNIVWMRNNGSDVNIMGAQIHWDGYLTTPAFTIDSSTYNDTYPTASSLLDGQSGPRPWMATWMRPYGTDYDVYAKVFSGSTLVAEANVSVLEGSFYTENQAVPDVDTNGQRFVISYCETYQGDAGDYDLYATTLHLEGGALIVDEAHVNIDYSSRSTYGGSISGGIEDATPGFGMYGLVWPRTSGVGDVFVGAYYEPNTVTSFCSGDGSAGACPCGNTGATGRGCANSATNGAGLFFQGTNTVSADTFSLQGFNMPTSTAALLFQGTSSTANGAPFGDGLRCVSGSVIRIASKGVSAGYVIYPEAGELPISAVGIVPADGGSRTYQWWYRNSVSFCTPATFNLTSAVRVLWLR